MPHLTQEQLNNNCPIPDYAKIVVVGAGMSGLYSTWRLLNETQGNDDIVILERSGRTGGRLDSDLVEFSDGDIVKEEEGGMRFLFEGMDDLMSLFMTLDLQDQIVPFPMNSGGNNRLYFRGHSFDVASASQDDYAIWSELYNLDPQEQGVNPKDIINVVFNRILAANPDFNQRPEVRGPEFWQAFRLDCQWNGVPLNEWSLWDLFTEMGYSNECITMLYRLLGFNGTFLSKMNAGVAYQLLEDFPADVKFRTFKDGFSTLPNKLVAEIGSQRIFLNTSVENIDQHEGDSCYTLTYSQINQQGEQEFKTIKAEKVILGLPRLALEKLFVKSNAFNRLPLQQSQQLWDTLQTTSNQPLLKINLYYDSAWWGNKISGRAPVEFGPNFADLPTGSVYPFYAISDEVVAGLEYAERVENPSPEIEAKLKVISESKYKKAAALTIYCDYLNINYWSGLQNNGELFTSTMQERYNEADPQTVFPASQAVVREATKYFKKIFNTHYVPEPVMTSARIWEGSVDFNAKPSQQFGYGVHQWAIGANDREVMAQLTEPLPNLYTCGEAFSDYQGWVEGALRSTDLVLNKAFGLAAFSQVFERQHGKPASVAISEAYYKNVTAMIQEYIDPNYQPNFEKDQQVKTQSQETCLGVDLTYLDQE
ncbi:amine oxidoreductase [Saccharobesus litoralis]|uniref:Amine oxidoreductase n=1 Tax=Saccharobesus litoralis TaxID=2172099 RepID=A0A2S0VVJ2_9ALTE|nr:FAD-dependent oxidoreductase [Saccharobesus litoralis]AWB68237.1 amine oxidoreductase [Saccharobesus litoralis]